MPTINFFAPYHKQETSAPLFGLCDDDDESPAYIDEILSNKDSKWIGVVVNSKRKAVSFYPVDKCVEIWEDENKMGSRCEGILKYDGIKLIFVELKDRKIKNTDWLSKAKGQIIATLKYFLQSYDLASFAVRAWICNKQLTYQNCFTQINSFRDETKSLFGKGILLHIDNTINL